MKTAKSFEISKQQVWESYLLVKKNGWAAGVDEESLEDFDRDLKNNLYRIWNRMTSGSYFPPPVKAVPIPKKSGGKRILGIPTVSDRIAQMVVKLCLEPKLEPHFHEDSYGYRPNKSAHQAIEVTRKRCWWHDWVLEFDIRELFDNIDHELLMKAVRTHTDCKWMLLYIERWLKAPMQMENEELLKREKGTPQGGVVSPLLANLFLHYAFDKWMVTRFPTLPFCRYADDGLVHCRSLEQAQFVRKMLDERFRSCGLELHPDKTKVAYCKDIHRPKEHEHIQFDFLGYTFRPRKSKDRFGRIFTNFAPGMSGKAATAIRQEIRSWRIQLKSDKSIEDLAKMFAPKIRGWVNYYCRFHKSAFHGTADHLNNAIKRWVMRKYKKLKDHPRKAGYWVGGVAHRQPHLFPHWGIGFKPSAG
ncbi:group II intron reverse transcriptase/maturase [Bdellovibrionota bacterium FG-2]